jgi:serine/threonine protein kinase
MKSITEPAQVSADVLMGQVVEDFLDRLNRGEQPEVDSYVERYPQLASVLGQMLPALELMRDAGADLASASDASSSPPLLAGCLGDFRILREIGRGGMGIVYEAEQISLGRRVALKVLPFAAALDAKQLQRFKNEAHAAAHLQHTNIVPVYYVGCERGVHFYAMQLVEGQTLAALIRELRQQEGRKSRDSRIEDRGSKSDGLPTPPKGPTEGFSELTGSYQSLGESPAGMEKKPFTTREAPTTIEDRVSTTDTIPPQSRSSVFDSRSSPFFGTVANLGIQAAEALEHAHQLGVTHRDIKPANLMVDARGNLWITDFGLAQCQGGCELTMSGDLLGTLRYMSPEQALGQRLALDHRTDLYSLGATLYELLTLEPAFPGEDRQALLRQIACEEPRRLRKLNKAIPAELETIVLKVLEKSPDDRYATAQELADDLRCFLEDKPIRARRPSIPARVRKWSWRHRGVVSATALTAVLVMSATSGVIAWKWRESEHRRVQAERAEHKTQAMNDFLLNDLIGAADPSEARGQKLTVEEVLDKAAARIDLAFPKEPEVEAAVRMAIGETYDHLGLYQKAEPQLKRALELRQQVLGEDHADTLHSMNELGNMLGLANRWTEAEPLFAKALAAARPVLGDEHPTTLELLHNNAWVLANLGQLSDAERLDRECLKIRLRLLGPDHEDTLTTMRNLGDHLALQGKFLEAEAVARECLRTSQRAFPADHPMIIVARGGLVYVLIYEEKAGELEPEARENVAEATRVWGTDHPRTWHCACRLALARYLQGKLEAAEQIARHAFDASRRVYKSDPPWDGQYQWVLGVVFQAEGRWNEAETMLQDCVNILRRRFGADNPFLLHRLCALGKVLQASGKRADAGKVLQGALDAQRKRLPPGHVDIVESLYAWAEYLLEGGDTKQAEAALREGLRIERQPVPRVQRLTGQMLAALGWALTLEGRAAEAEPLLREALEILSKEFPTGHWAHWMAADAQSRLGGCRVALGRFAEAESDLQAAYQVLQGAGAVPPARFAQAGERIVKLYETWGKPDKAVEWRAKSPQPKPSAKETRKGK